jgi:hypothetical protein
MLKRSFLSDELWENEALPRAQNVLRRSPLTTSRTELGNPARSGRSGELCYIPGLLRGLEM